MKAVLMHTAGGPDVLSVEEIDPQAPGPGESVVGIKAIGVNYTDIYTRSGVNQPPNLPWVPGLEGAGVVLANGSGVTEVAVGDLVAFTGVVRSYAEQVVAPSWRLVKMPDGISAEVGAAAMLQGMTAHYLCLDTYKVCPGDTVLIHAGAGGVGLLLIQMVKRLGCKVITTVSTPEKAALAKDAGADISILYTQEDFAKVVMEVTNGVGVQAVYDSVGKDTFEKSIACLVARGHMVLYGASSGPIPPIPLSTLAKGSIFFSRPTLTDYTANRDELLQRAGDVLGWVRSQELKVRIFRTYRLDEVVEAHRDLEGRVSTGKILLIP